MSTRSRTATLGRHTWQLCVGALVGTLACVALAVVAPMAAGWRTFTVMSGSMTPAVRTGDAVVVRPVQARSVRPGDVVTFRDPHGTGRLITHRVREVRRTAAGVDVVTRGDANNTDERWQAPARGAIGRVVYRIPRAGYLLVPGASPVGRIALTACPAVLLGVLGLRTIWRRDAAATGTTETAPLPGTAEPRGLAGTTRPAARVRLLLPAAFSPPGRPRLADRCSCHARP